MYSVQGIFQHHFQCIKVHTILDKIWYLAAAITLQRNKKHRQKQKEKKSLLFTFMFSNCDQNKKSQFLTNYLHHRYQKAQK